MVRVQYCKHTDMIIAVIFLGVLPMTAFFESITVWRGPSGQLVYGVADYGSQLDIRSIFDRFAQEHKQQEFLTIVEDYMGYTGHDVSAKKFFDTYERALSVQEEFDTPLAGLTKMVEVRGFPVMNAEFRYLRVAGLAMVQQEAEVKSSRQYRSSPFPISGHEIVQEHQETALEIGHYADRSLQDYYQDTLRAVREPAVSTLESVGQDHEDIVQYINARIPLEHRLFFSETLSRFDAPLLDARVMHHVVTHCAIKKILLFCGGVHTYQIGKVLERLLHYKKVAHVGVTKEYPYRPLTFNPAQEVNTAVMTDLTSLGTQELELIGANEPERFASGSFS